jgi:inhibitor of KinA sporulation pathway (predicted exonuclease)
LAAPDTLAILDLEYTSWEGARERAWSGPGEHREIVEIGLLLVRGETLEEITGLSMLVRPRRNPLLSAYFRDLTGITQSAIDLAPDFATAAALLDRLLTGGLRDSREPHIWSFGEDGEILAENYGLNDLPAAIAPGCFRNIRPALTTALGLPARGVDSGELPKALGLEGFGPAHRALDDCRAIAAALRIASTRGAGI